jgi:hypothetical protein
MLRVGFESTIPAAKTVHALDSVATVIGFTVLYNIRKRSTSWVPPINNRMRTVIMQMFCMSVQLGFRPEGQSQ